MTSPERDRRIDYVEFGATDIPRTRAFYEEVFGWRFEDYGPAYSSFQDGRIAGGFEQRSAVHGGGPLVVIYAANLEAVEQAVTRAGGTIVRPTFTFPGGRRFHFRDPSGNELAVWSEV